MDRKNYKNKRGQGVRKKGRERGGRGDGNV